MTEYTSETLRRLVANETPVPNQGVRQLVEWMNTQGFSLIRRSTVNAHADAWEAAEREGGWMRRVLRGIGHAGYMQWVEGPWYATGDLEELVFFRYLDPLLGAADSALAREEKPHD